MNEKINNAIVIELLPVVSKHVLLTPSRKNLKGSCPFHQDLTTSLMVSPDKNIFKCFGCGKEGGPIEFVMYLKNKNRDEAIALLSEMRV